MSFVPQLRGEALVLLHFLLEVGTFSLGLRLVSQLTEPLDLLAEEVVSFVFGVRDLQLLAPVNILLVGHVPVGRIRVDNVA